MNDFLHKDKLQYDAPRYDEMYVFLNHILTIAKSNPDIHVSDRIIYNELEKFTLPGKDFQSPGQAKKVEHLFPKWIERFKGKNNIRVFHTESWPYWCQFTNNSQTDEFIKLYVPIDGEGLEECVNLIFDFMAKNNMRHQSKVGKFLRNDNVVIRLDKGEEESLRKLINFITNNEKIQKHLNKTNPFLPNINGIGVMNETGITYNGELCELIAAYVEEKRNQQTIDVEDFIKYVKNNTYKQEIYAAFEHATSSEPSYFDANEYIYGPVRKKGLNEQQKMTILNDALIATFNKYGIEQVIGALKKIIKNNDYRSITNGRKGHREILEKNVSKDDIARIITNNVQIIYRRGYANLNDELNAYCSYLFSDGFVEKLDEMCEVTLENRGADYLKRAIDGYAYSGAPHNFSRFKKGDKSGRNYRNNCSFIPQRFIYIAVRKSLQVKGVSAAYISNDRLAEVYAETLKNSRYEQNINQDDDIKIYR